MSDFERTSNSFIFVLNCGEKLLYGVCVLSEELEDYKPSFITKSPVDIVTGGDSPVQRALNPKQRLLGKKSVTSLLRSYCIISQFPFFREHFGVIYSILG